MLQSILWRRADSTRNVLSLGETMLPVPRGCKKSIVAFFQNSMGPKPRTSFNPAINRQYFVIESEDELKLRNAIFIRLIFLELRIKQSA